MGEHSYTAFRLCDGDEGCNGAGFKRIGAIGDGSCTYVPCVRCGGTGQFYLQVKNPPAPVEATPAGTSLQAQRSVTAAKQDADMPVFLACAITVEEIAEFKRRWDETMNQSQPRLLLTHDGQIVDPSDD